MPHKQPQVFSVEKKTKNTESNGMTKEISAKRSGAKQKRIPNNKNINRKTNTGVWANRKM